jgi:hypothetical protein
MIFQQEFTLVLRQKPRMVTDRVKISHVMYLPVLLH